MCGVINDDLHLEIIDSNDKKQSLYIQFQKQWLVETDKT